jgi:hypothetical protein
MLRLWVRILVSMTWFGPLPLISGLRLVDTDAELAVALVLVGIAVCASNFAILLPAHRQIEQKVEFVGKERIPFEWAAQLSTFILPFLAFRLSVLADLAALAFVVVMTVTILARSGDFIANPLLALGGYVVYNVKFRGGREGIVIARGRPQLTTSAVHLRTIQDGLYVGRWEDASEDSESERGQSQDRERPVRDLLVER